MKKRLLSIALVLVLVLTVLQISGSKNEALAMGYIETVTVSVTEPEAGKFPDVPYVEESGLDIAWYHWYGPNGSGEDGELIENDKFLEGETYLLRMCVEVTDPERTAIYLSSLPYINGQEAEVYSGDETWIVIGYDYEIPESPKAIYVGMIDIDLKAPQPGEYPSVPVSRDKNVTVKSYNWYGDNGSGDHGLMLPGDPFVAGNDYIIRMVVGATYPDDTNWSVGMDSYIRIGGQKGMHFAGENKESVIGADFTCPDKVTISTINATMPELVAGQRSGSVTITPLTEGVVVDSVSWYDYGTDDDYIDGGRVMAPTATFRAGHYYGAKIIFSQESTDYDWAITNDSLVYVNNWETTIQNALMLNRVTGLKGVMVMYNTECPYPNKIEELKFDIVRPVAGQYPVEPICFTEGVDYDAYWFGPNGSGEGGKMLSTDMFVSGLEYGLRINAHTSNEDTTGFYVRTGNVYFGPQKVYAYAGTLHYISVGYDYVCTTGRRFDLLNFAVEEPEAGKAPTVPTCLTEDCIVTSYAWFGENGSGDFNELIDGDVFLEGKTYTLRLWVEIDGFMKDAFDLKNNSQIKFNGKDGILYEVPYPTEANVGATFVAKAPTKEPLHELDLTSVDFEHGKSDATVTSSDLDILKCEWYYAGKKLTSTDTYTAGNEYTLKVEAKLTDAVSERYYIANDTPVYFNGDDGTIDEIKADGTALMTFKSYCPGATADRITFEVKRPEPGENKSAPVCTTEGIRIINNSWTLDGNALTNSDTFAYGKTYQHNIMFTTDDSGLAVIPSDVMAFINGRLATVTYNPALKVYVASIKINCIYGVDELNLSAAKPMPGKTPGEVSCDNSRVVVNYYKWYAVEKSGMELLTEDSKFEDGKEYMLAVSVTTVTEDVEFFLKSDSVKINGEQATISFWDENAAFVNIRFKAPITVTFNANGGKCLATFKEVDLDKPYGGLPVPTRDGYTFKGWSTSTSGKPIITKDTVVSIDKAHTLYAIWETADPVEAFVTRLYSVCLDRKPDKAGLNDWTNKLKSKQISGVTAAYGFIFSPEFLKKNLCNADYVEYLYKAFMGRGSDPAGKKDWVKQLESGVTREAVFNGFALSNEFGTICKNAGIAQGSGIAVPQFGTVPTGKCSVCGKEDGVTSFVKRLYSVCLNRTADAAGLKDWCGKLWRHEMSGSQVAYGFIFSPEFVNKNYSNADYVEYLYKAFMGRGSDPAGKKDWVGKLNSGWTRKQVFDGFVGSQEFTKICQSYGILR